jgi:hypothetical protein
MTNNETNNIEDEMPDEGYFLVEPRALARVQGGKWLSIDGDCFTVVGWKEPDEEEPYYIRLHIKKIDRPLDYGDGYIGTFYRRAEHLNEQDDGETN